MAQEPDAKLRCVSSPSALGDRSRSRPGLPVWFQHYRKENFHDESLPQGKWTKRESKQSWVRPSFRPACLAKPALTHARSADRHVRPVRAQPLAAAGPRAPLFALLGLQHAHRVGAPDAARAAGGALAARGGGDGEAGQAGDARDVQGAGRPQVEGQDEAGRDGGGAGQGRVGRRLGRYVVARTERLSELYDAVAFPSRWPSLSARRELPCPPPVHLSASLSFLDLDHAPRLPAWLYRPQ